MDVLVDPPRRGAENMERDLALLARGAPVVRLYAWYPACVSLGYAQPESDVDLAVASAEGLDVVRRPTGGGAILHEADEVTYAVVLPRAMAPGSLFDSYKLIAGGVVRTLERLGVQASFVEGHAGRDPLCYLREEGVSVSVGGRKISGGAQKRTNTHLLQHGTILLSRRSDLMARLFHTSSERIEQQVACLQDFRPSIARAEVVEAAQHGFREALSHLPSAAVV